MGGDYNIPVRCEDEAGNIEEDYIVFDLTIDRTDPVIATIYESGGNLEITTYKESFCYVNSESCNFGIDPIYGDTLIIDNNGGTASPGTVHTLDWDIEKTYNIRCKDNWGLESDCETIAPTEFY